VKQILVVMEGGVIQDVVGVPEGYELVVRDYDVEGCDNEDYLNDGVLFVHPESGLCTQFGWCADPNEPAADLSDVRPATKEDIGV